MATKISVLSLYKNLLRESMKFSSYNYRNYAIKRIKDAFQENKNETDPLRIKKLLCTGNESLQVIKRQVVINQLYAAPKLVIETAQ